MAANVEFTAVPFRRRGPSGTWAVIGTGPSLTKEDCEKAKAFTILGVSDAYRIADCDHLYAADAHWWRHHWQFVKDLRCEKWTQIQNQPKLNDSETKLISEFGLSYVFGKHLKGLGKEWLHYGESDGLSGTQAINLAYLLGAEKILLLGFDGKNAGGKTHFFGEHPNGWTNGGGKCPAQYSFLAKDLKAEGVPIINCSRSTAIPCFEKASIDEQI